MTYVLVVDDEPDLRGALEDGLSFEGYEVATAGDGNEALESIEHRTPDLLVLDVQLPTVDGFEVCRRMRAHGLDIPVIMLTARDTTADRVAGLDHGADDYLVKPFVLDELLARLRALLRRQPGAVTPQVLRTFGDISLDPNTRTVFRNNDEITLTRTEFQLLSLFLQHPRRVLTREFILREVWGFDFDPGSNTMDVFIGYLRRKTEIGGRSRLIHNVRGVGYVLRES